MIFCALSPVSLQTWIVCIRSFSSDQIQSPESMESAGNVSIYSVDTRQLQSRGEVGRCSPRISFSFNKCTQENSLLVVPVKGWPQRLEAQGRGAVRPP